MGNRWQRSWRTTGCRSSTGWNSWSRRWICSPGPRRALLTACADTDAAIQAINVVDVDHYLLKPWDPPEEKLYPVVDALIETWRAIGETAVEQTRVIGHRWSAPSYQARDFLARNAVPYRWYSVDDPEGQRLLDAASVTARTFPL